MTFSYFGLPTMDGNDDFGASSPEIPALHIPEPLSIITDRSVLAELAV
jgi:hypothetical protein